MTKITEDVACTVCGCVCDDLRLHVTDGRITRAEGACALSEPWLLGQGAPPEPPATIEGAPAAVSAAVERAAEILAGVRFPLIYGLSRSSTQGQRSAVALADLLGANIDTTASRCHAPSIMALQQVGESTCSLGEIRNRADLVIYWGSNPQKSHPRHLERYVSSPRGQHIPAGRADRTLVVVDVHETETAAEADLFLQVEPGRDFEMLWKLRALVRGVSFREPTRGATSPGICEDSPPAAPSGSATARAALEDLAERMRNCRCGVIFFGLGLTQQQLGHHNVEALLRLVTELNQYTRFHARRMRVAGDVTGADTVLCWQTGYPFSVNLSAGYPRYNPGEFSANGLLERREIDACLLVGSEGVPALSAAAQRHLEQIPTITLDYPIVPSTIAPTVRITTAVYGVHLPGTAYRMDEVPIPLRAVLPAEHPSDAEVLDAIGLAVRGRI